MSCTKQNVIGNWFHNYHRENIVPDLGYFIGFKICESYYNKTEDKSKAIEFLMTEKDHSKILELSNYDGGK